MSFDPTSTDPDKYVPIFENDWGRVLDYCDHPGQHTEPHQHPNSAVASWTGKVNVQVTRW